MPAFFKLLAVLFCLTGPVSPAFATNESHRDLDKNGSLQAEISLLYDVRRERAAAYGEWVYEWTASYVSAYRVAGRIIASTAKNPMGWRENVQDVMSNFYGEIVRDRVMMPEEGIPALFQIVDRQIKARTYLLIEQEALKTCGLANPACLTATRASLQTSALRALRESRSQESHKKDFAEALDAFTIAAQDDYYVLRSTRPFILRVILFVLRVTEMATVIFLFTGLLRATAIPITLTTTFVVAVLVSWGLDYAVHSVDAHLNKKQFIEIMEGQVDDRRPLAFQFATSRIVGAEIAFQELIAESKGPAK